jgi:tRNA nucleotidyltransferase (CCA-adding enzyme)
VITIFNEFVFVRSPERLCSTRIRDHKVTLAQVNPGNDEVELMSFFPRPNFPVSLSKLHRLTHGVIPTTISLRIFHSCAPMKRKTISEGEDSPSKKVKSTMATTTIQLTPRESQLRNLLLDVAHYIDESKEIKEKIELRFAGGWVRDKLLDIQSHDIDTAINAMTGFAFSTKMQDYLKNEENMKKHSLEAKDLGSLHKILANPEKSKHLETATTKIFGFDVDFVNLRKETYSEDSRNPQMEFGTAIEDAERRDATINALFYNLHSDQVEDFTGGLADLAGKRIRTPLEPRTTFMDDPLRVLRLIRFASRLDFRIDPESESWMSDPAVMDALKVKISRERVGVEIEKMLKGS